MKKILIGLVLLGLLALIGYTGYVYEKAHSISGSVSVINNAQVQTKQKYIPRIPLPTEFPEQPASPMPAAAEPYVGTWVVTSEVGRETYPAPEASTYGVGKTITIEPDYFNNNSQMFPQEMKNPQYSIIYPDAAAFQTSFPYIDDVGGAGGLGLYDGVETLVVNNHGITPNPSPNYNFAAVYLMGGYIIVDSNGVFFKCVRQK